MLKLLKGLHAPLDIEIHDFEKCFLVLKIYGCIIQFYVVNATREIRDSKD